MGVTAVLLLLAACTAPEPVDSSGDTSDVGADTGADSGEPIEPCTLAPDATDGTPWTFTDVSEAAGAAIGHGFDSGDTIGEPQRFSSGLAVADIDGDCDLDVYLTTGTARPEALLVNQGDGTFVDEGQVREVDRFFVSSGPAFFDADADGDVDLLVGAVGGGRATLFANDGAGFFSEVPGAMGLEGLQLSTYGAGQADWDGDGDLDLALARWRLPADSLTDPQMLWRNDGGSWTDVSSTLSALGMGFSPAFGDLDNDADPDLAFAADFGRSQVFRNQQGAWTDVTDTTVITDDNGMGGVLADFDNDGDLDWFVTSIMGHDGLVDWNQTGNRLYVNDGSGVFTDNTQRAGVRDGGWGWAACAGDLDNDGWLDIVQVGGHAGDGIPSLYREHDTRLFHNQGDGTFVEVALALGLRDPQQGHGLACQDFDRDGDLDLLTSNSLGTSTLFRNDGGGGHSIEIIAPVGTRLEVDAGGQTQLREVTAGGTYQSWTPNEVHVGLGAATVIDELRIRWPGGQRQTMTAVEVDQLLRLER